MTSRGTNILGGIARAALCIPLLADPSRGPTSPLMRQA